MVWSISCLLLQDSLPIFYPAELFGLCSKGLFCTAWVWPLSGDQIGEESEVRYLLPVGSLGACGVSLGWLGDSLGWLCSSTKFSFSHDSLSYNFFLIFFWVSVCAPSPQPFSLEVVTALQLLFWVSEQSPCGFLYLSISLLTTPQITLMWVCHLFAAPTLTDETLDFRQVHRSARISASCSPLWYNPST